MPGYGKRPIGTYALVYARNLGPSQKGRGDGV